MGTSHIRFTQGVTVNPPGKSAFGAQGTQVVVSNGDDSNIKNWQFTLLDVPRGSSLVPGVVQDGPSSTWAFTPDSTDSFLVQLVTTDNDGVVATDIRAFIVKRASQKWIPPFMSSELVYDAEEILDGVSDRGWAMPMEDWLSLLDSLGVTGGTTTQAGFNVPTLGQTVVVQVQSSAAAVVNQCAQIAGRSFVVDGIVDATHIRLRNSSFANVIANIPSQTLVGFMGLPSAAKSSTVLPGEALVADKTGALTGAGHYGVINILEFTAVVGGVTYQASGDASASGDQVVATRACIQLACDQAVAFGYSVFFDIDPSFPSSTLYITDQPIFAAQGIQILGVGCGPSGRVGIRSDGNNSFLSPAFVFAYTTALAPVPYSTENGVTVAAFGPFTYNTLTYKPYIDVGRVPGTNYCLNGRTAWTYRQQLNPLAVSGAAAVGSVFSIRGTFNDTGLSTDGAVDIKINQDGGSGGYRKLTIRVNTSSGLVSFTSTNALAANTLSEIALVFDSANSQMRLYINGTLDSTAAVVHNCTTVQAQSEDMLIGAVTTQFANSAIAFDAGLGYHAGGWELNSFVKYSANYVPTPTVIYGDLFYIDLGDSTVAAGAPRPQQFFKQSGGLGWNFWQGVGTQNYISNLEVSHLAIASAVGIIAYSVLDSSFHHLNVSGNGVGIDFEYFSYRNTVRDCSFLSNANPGHSSAVYITPGSQFISVQDCSIIGYFWGVMGLEGFVADNIYMNPTVGTAGFFYVNHTPGGQTTFIRNIHGFDETTPITIASIYLVHVLNVEINGQFTPLYNANTCPAVIMDHCVRVRISGILTTYNAATPVLKFLTPNAVPAHIALSQDAGSTFNFNAPLVDPAHADFIEVENMPGSIAYAQPDNDVTLSGSAAPLTSATPPVNDFFTRALEVTGAWTGDRQYNVPYSNRGYLVLVRNTTSGGHNLLYGNATARVTIAPGTAKWCEPDGAGGWRQAA